MDYKSNIIPVTKEIRDYIRSNSNDREDLVDFDSDLEKYMQKAEDYDKSLVWVYQSMVLDGYGRYIDMNSDIYQASLIAYVDVLSVIENKKENLPFFEKFCVLEGDLYNQMLLFDKKKRVKK